MTNKKLLLIVVIMLLVSSCVFGDEVVSSSSFYLKHRVNVVAKYSFEFWDPSSRASLTSVSFESGGTYTFATLMVLFNQQIKLKDLKVSFTDLVSDAGTGEYYPYTMQALKPDTNETLATITSVSNGHGAGSFTLYKTQTTLKYDKTTVINTDEIVDFVITLDDTDVPAGTYSGSITLTYTVI